MIALGVDTSQIKNWLQTKPERGQPNSVMNRHEDHTARKLPKPKLSFEWGDQAARARKLTRRREKWKRLLENAADDSDSSSTSSDEENPSDSEE